MKDEDRCKLSQIDEAAIREVADWLVRHRGDKAFYSALSEKLLRALGDKRPNG